MEKNPLLSMLPHKIVKPKTTNQLNDSPDCNTTGFKVTKNDYDRPLTLQPPEEFTFRLLCHIHTVGGIIGGSGSVVKRLETLAGVKIHIEKGVRNCHERVINISGDSSVDEKISTIFSSVDGGSGKEEMIEVSKVQEGLMKVFERVLEVQAEGRNENSDINRNGSGVIGCRLLAAPNQIGAVLGRGGEIVNVIRNSTKAKIKVSKEQIPACAGPREAVIQITGGALSVKKALLNVSRCLQDCKLGERTSVQMFAGRVSHDSHEDTVDCHPIGHKLSADIDRKVNLDDDGTPRKVVFRFLCSNTSAGGVIGKGRNIVKSMENETGASIKFSSFLPGATERCLTISSVENPNALYSSAQIAIMRVFARSVEVSLDRRLIPGIGEGNNVTARLLVERNQMGCLVDEGGRVDSDIITASSVKIQLLGTDHIPNFTVEGDTVVQIIGEYDKVKSALSQVTSRLRDYYFSRMGPEEADDGYLADSVMACSKPNQMVMGSSFKLEQSSSLNYVDQLDFVHNSSDHLSTGLCEKGEAKSRQNAASPEEDVGNLGTYSSQPKNRSMVGDAAPYQTVEVLIPQNVIHFVYGDNGSNLMRMKEISRAAVEFSHRCAGDEQGKVIISGSPEQIQIAQTLLQAFMLT